MPNIKFEIVTPEKIVLKEQVLQITVPTKQGEITVLPNHTPLVAALMPGVIEVLKINGERDIMSLSGGFIEVMKDKVVILADTAERAEDLDHDRIEAARLRAEDSIKNIRHFDRESFISASAALAKELARSKAEKRWKKIRKL